MKEFDYEEVLAKVLDTLIKENIILEIDWGEFKDNKEKLNIIINNKVLSFEYSKDSSEVDVSIDLLS